MGYDSSTFFDQYLRTSNIPVFEYNLNDGLLEYKWTNVVDGFKMPIELFVDDKKIRLNPTQEIKTINVKSEKIRLDKNYYVNINKV